MFAVFNRAISRRSSCTLWRNSSIVVATVPFYTRGVRAVHKTEHLSAVFGSITPGNPIPTLRFKISDSKFAVVAEDIYDRKIEFIKAGNIYYTRKDELPGLFDAAQKLGVCLDHRPIKQRTNKGILRVDVVRSKTG